MKLCVNGKYYEVKSSLGIEYRLIDFLRDECLATSVKRNCGEGGCGVCIVTVTKHDALSGDICTFSVNSCLIPVLSCDGWEVTTTEGLGSRHKGLHHIQQRLANGHGIQCGFCSPGMVMSMNSLIEEKNGKQTVADVERALDGNLCRCTGYRPILDAFKSTAEDADESLKKKFFDIEDLSQICKKSGAPCNGTCATNGTPGTPRAKYVELLNGERWHYPTNLEEAFAVVNASHGQSTYRLVAGNTGNGVYKEGSAAENVIDLSHIKELLEVNLNGCLSVGAGVSLSKLIDVFEKHSNKDGFAYLTPLKEHVQLIGSTPVRNVGTVGGNLILKHGHKEFPSDIFVILEAAGAKLNIASEGGSFQKIGLAELLSLSMEKKIIVSVDLPALPDATVTTYKITPRTVNAHAYVNAAFCFELDENKVVVQRPHIVYGGISSNFVHATNLEGFLVGKSLKDQNVFSEALLVLDAELQLDSDFSLSSPNYRRALAKNLFYKTVLSLLGSDAPANAQSGGYKIQRPVSSGRQEFEHLTDEYPVGKPMKKLEADVQATGEAEFVGDIYQRPNQLHAAFIVAPVGPAILESINASSALSMPGVVRLISAQDVVGKNSFCDYEVNFMAFRGDEEEIFASREIKYAGQPVGLIVAETRQQALKAAKMVQVVYSNAKRPVLDVKEAIEIPERCHINCNFGPPQRFCGGDYEEARKGAVTVIRGEFTLRGQHHFPMETQTALCIPMEDGVDVFLATQDADTATSVISRALGIQKNRVNLQVRRIGGGFGHKASRSGLIGCACAVAAHALNKPVSLVMDLQSNLKALGGRTGYYVPYEVGVDAEGLLQNVKIDFYGDVGSSFNESVSGLAANDCKNCYSAKAWQITPWSVKTDKPSNAFMRAPGSECGIGVMEIIMDRISEELGMDPVELRMKNLRKEEPPSVSSRGAFSGFHEGLLRNLVDVLKEKSEYYIRKEQIDLFNKENRWKKRGIAFNLMTYPFELMYFQYNVLVSIYHNGGTVSIAHGGIEMGQGINTKVAQVAARELGIPVEFISIKPTNVLTNPNGSVSAASITSELNCYAVYVACRELAERIKPVRESLGEKATWKEVIDACHMRQVDLCARKHYSAGDKLPGYNVYAGVVTEVELDVLTGERQVRRVDLVEDAGRSVSPWIDIGQIEGAFVQGLGLYLTEHLKFDPETGGLLSNGTWDYKPPTAFDIPAEFNVTMLSNVENTVGVLRSKTTGEPALVLAISILNAFRHSLLSARADAGHPGSFDFNPPALPEFLQLLTCTEDKHLNVC